MIRIKLAGGVGEHGRSCFLVEGDAVSFLVDCGIMTGSEDPYPHLTAPEMKRIAYVFLTHSHMDHTGALAWLEENGFSGTVIASAQTLAQLKTLPQRSAVLENADLPAALKVKWGRSGHCVGSVWYQFQLEGKTLLFSGDYTEESAAYSVDPIRGVTADLAVLDSAYGAEKRTAQEMRREFLDAAAQLLSAHGSLLLPVPKYGRGWELLLMLHQTWPDLPLYGDEFFLEQLTRLKDYPEWCTAQLRQEGPGIQVGRLADAPQGSGIGFISNPQLSGSEQERMARRYHGAVILTGTVEKETGSGRLLEEGLAAFCRIPVHCTDRERLRLEQQNRFGCVIPYHTKAHSVKKTEIFL